MLSLRNPSGTFKVSWSWQSKVVYVLRTAGKPLRSQEIFEQLSTLDKTLAHRANPMVYLGVVLANGKTGGRVIPFKLKGVRGSFYALPEWINEGGTLMDEMKQAIF